MSSDQANGPLWAALHAAPKHPSATLRRAYIPVSPGVYAWYRRGQAIYVGKADSLASRLWSQHLGQSASLHNSAFRRNVAESLGFGAPADIYSGRVRLEPGQLRAVRDWIMTCSVAWIQCATKLEAAALESDLKAESMPKLTKR